MILVTVGSQLPFDRLVKLVDEIAPELAEPVFAQIGKTSYVPTNIESMPMIEPSRFDAMMAKASLIVSHAGIGSVLTAQAQRKPILLFPRRTAFGEHRNDHQLATAAALRGRPGIYVAETGAELQAQLRQATTMTAALPDMLGPARLRLLSSLSEHLAQLGRDRASRKAGRQLDNG